jgi:hypothetical protein
MKIIENNYKPELKEPSRITCPGCESVIEYTDEDLTLRFSRTEGWTNSVQRYIGFACPCCGYQLGIKDA